ATSIVYALVEVDPAASVARRVKPKLPFCVGVPTSAPFPIVTPGGSVPASTVHVTAPFAPITLSGWLYATPVVPAANCVLGHASAIRSVYVRDPGAAPAPAALIVNV